MNRFLRGFFFLVTGNPGVRFRKYDKPTQATYQQLFDSVAFMKESADSATTLQQGLGKIAQDSDAINRNSTPDADAFTKIVKPHMLPNVLVNPATPGTALTVTTANNTTGRTGGSGKDFYIQNTMEVTSTSPEIVVTQGNPGEDVVLSFNPGTLDLGKVLVNASDPTASYLEDAVETDTPCLLEITPNGTNEKLKFNLKVRVGDLRMYAGTNIMFAADFPANIGTGCWAGYVLADGGTYTDSNGNLVAVPDMTGYFPVGYQNPGNYTTLRSHTDATAASGADSVALITAELPVHNHSAGTLATASDGAHTHSVSIKYHINSPSSGDPNDYNALECDQLSNLCNLNTASDGTHTHTISGSTGNAGSGTAHENRPPFTVVAFVYAIG